MRPLLILALAGCLSAPERPAEPIDAGVLDAPPLFPFPSGVAIRNAPKVADLNGDDKDDVLLANVDVAGGTGDNHGLYVLYGRADGFLDGYDLFLSTAPAEPVATVVGDFMGGPDQDILVLGRPPTGDGRLIAFEGRGTQGFAPSIFKVTTGYRPGGGTLAEPEPVFVALARVGGANKRDAVFGDLTHVFAVVPAAWTSVDLQNAGQEPLPLPGGNPWEAVNDVIASPSAVDGRDDLIVVQNSSVHWYFHADSFAGYDAQSIATWPLTDPGRMAGRFADIDLNRLPDLVRFRDENVRFVLFDRQGTADPTAVERGFESTIDFADQAVDDYAVVNLDTDPRPELIVLDNDPAGSTYGIRVFGNLYDNGSGLVVGDPRELPALQLPPGHPTRMLVGNFVGVKEIRLMSADLMQKDCFVAKPTGAGNMFELSGCQ